MPALDDALKPSHMATLRRCWMSSGGYVEDNATSPGGTTNSSPACTSSFKCKGLAPPPEKPSWPRSITQPRSPPKPPLPQTQQPPQQSGINFFAARHAGHAHRSATAFSAPGARSVQASGIGRERPSAFGDVTPPVGKLVDQRVVPPPSVEPSTAPQQQFPPSLPVNSRRHLFASKSHLFATDSKDDPRGFTVKARENDRNNRRFAPPNRANSVFQLGVNGASTDAHASGARAGSVAGVGVPGGIGVRFIDAAEEQFISDAAGLHDDRFCGLLDSGGEDVLSADELPRPVVRSQKRPSQVPRLNLAFVEGGPGKSDDPLTKHKWGLPTAPAATTYASDRGGGANARPKGFACASGEDQQRIAEFYGYRDEGFIATMQSLQTDMIRPRLYVGNMADAAYLPLLRDLGITHVVNCAIEAQKAKPPYETQGIQYHFVPLQDNIGQTEALTRQRFRSIRDATKTINCALKGSSKGSVLVHCVQGVSRSAALACAYLMEYEGLAMERAIAEVKLKHPGCLTAQHWQAFLYRYKAELLRGH
eukprot:TRINITY_DN5195_c0_g1_i1.p1 TRINITY_DN5195_c0_g1~~TRINITY_DN5195_c0_g1_i1.p1  ORF type:complete len:604 (+),score=110.84 TRINITY_DN5195_c0_g1_i1:208-1812(+)